MVGMWLLRARWRELVPLYATIFVITAIYVPYTIKPRYTLPARPKMIIFEAVALMSTLQKAGCAEVQVPSKVPSRVPGPSVVDSCDLVRRLA